MTLYASADLLQMWRDQTKRPTTDAAWPNETVYRLLSRAQVQVTGDIAALFPRLLMTAPILLETADNGATYTATTDDSDGTPIYPMGHAEVYGKNGDVYNREYYATTYGSNDGGLVLEGNTFRIPQGRTGTITTDLYVRCVPMPEAISASSEPTLKPYWLRELIVWRACSLFARAGGQQDPRPYDEGYQMAWTGQDGRSGFLATLTTQYARSADAALVGTRWWRAWLAGGGARSLTSG